MALFRFSLLLSPALLLAAPPPLSETYKDAATQIISAALGDQDGYAKLSYLCDRIGNRLSGSDSLNAAIEWAAAQMKRDGLENVSTSPVKVPHWVRGHEDAEIVKPVRHDLTMLGLGGSVATPSEGITAEVVPVSSFDALTALGRDKVAGKIVLFNVPYEGYGKTVMYRVTGASRAAQLGAVAMLLRSVGSLAMQTPHTGAMNYSAADPKIPAAAITFEDATMIQRLTDAGTPVTVHLYMEAHMLPDADSANVMGEIRGREKPEEIVVIGGHIDSWDVGAGAQDDGSGIMASLEAAVILKKLGLRPRRTLRVVFWTNEENGSAGGQAYRLMVGDQIHNYVASIEMDGGAEKPVGFGVSPGGAVLARVRDIGHLLAPIGADTIREGGGGADIGPLMHDGVPGLGLFTVGQHYFDWHHTRTDTVDKIDPKDFQQCIAAMAVMSYVLADMPERLGD
ncbi:MAG TPA: M20/M25/M40 family metallo-hydrolase [Bryobacteraceae bacterium]|nr:M20/M25/M40 family metallo-hydrolase [Bryobacteraceae bacterium]